MKQEVNWKKLNREQRGLLIYQTLVITRTTTGWRVPSQRGKGSYTVTLKVDQLKCTCPDSELTREKCKHIFAVEYFVKKTIDEEGNLTETKGVRVTYPQDWKSYDKVQTNEGLLFMKLLSDLCTHIEQPLYKFGRPSLSQQDLLFCSTLKIYSTFSLRRFMSQAKIAKEMQLINKVPCYASVGHFLQKSTTTVILKRLIHLSSLPLREVEVDFAIDSSGFSTSRFARYFDYKHRNYKEYKQWIKAHVMSGVKTNIITAVEITKGSGADSPQLPRLVDETSKEFKLGGVSCDKAYSGRENLQKIHDAGGTPYIPFRKNATGKNRRSGFMWRKMYHYFMYKHEEFLKEYHKRSNVETCFHMIKTKFKDNLRSTTETAQINELLTKILCHNILVVAHEIEELNIKGDFMK